jgi:hypothetical protein
MFDEVRVDVHLADIVHDDGKLDAALILQYFVYECCLSAAQITCEQQNGDVLYFHFVSLLPISRQR